MKLPNAESAVVEEAKIVEYLLNPTHPWGASKARFFTHFGFRADAWQVMAVALLEHGQQNDVIKVRETASDHAMKSRAN